MKNPEMTWINRIALGAGIAAASWLIWTAVFAGADSAVSAGSGRGSAAPAQAVLADASKVVDDCCAVGAGEDASASAPAHAAIADASKVVDDCCAVGAGEEASVSAPAPAALADASKVVDDCCAIGAEGVTPAVASVLPDNTEVVDDCCAVGADAEAPARTAGKLQPAHDGPWCGEHNVPELQCAICQPQRTAGLEAGDSLLLRMVSTESAAKSGVLVGPAEAGRVTPENELLCEVSYDQTRKAHITPRVSGRIEAVYAVVGEEIAEGDALLRLSSPEIAAAKERLLTAVADARLADKQLSGEEALWAASATSRQSVDEARAGQQKSANRVAAARQELLNMGLSEANVAEVLKTSNTDAEVLVQAPFAGTLVEQHAVIGELAVPGSELFTLVDLSSMWLTMSIPVQRAGSVNRGDAVLAHFEGLGDQAFEASVDWISPQVDSVTRTVAARAVLENADGILRSGLFGRVRLPGKDTAEGLRVPIAAVQHYDGRPYVFVQNAPDLFEVRQVRLGNESLGRTEILAGLMAGEPVVMEGGYLVKSEFLKARLGAGCTDH